MKRKRKKKRKSKSKSKDGSMDEPLEKSDRKKDKKRRKSSNLRDRDDKPKVSLALKLNPINEEQIVNKRKLEESLTLGTH